MISFKTILCPIDFGLHSKRAIDVAIDLAQQYRGTVHLFHTWQIPVYPYTSMEVAMPDLLGPMENAATRDLAAALADAKKRMVGITASLARGEPWREILALIEASKPDLVVMGTRGRTGIQHYVLGSTAEKVVRVSPVPVLTLGLHDEAAAPAIAAAEAKANVEREVAA